MADRAIGGGSEYTGTRQGEDIYERLRVLEQMLSRSFLRGRLLHAEPGEPAGSGIYFSNTDDRFIPHGLGRRAVGFFQVMPVDMGSALAQGQVVVRAFSNGITSKTHIACASASVGRTFLWVF